MKLFMLRLLPFLNFNFMAIHFCMNLAFKRNQKKIYDDLNYRLNRNFPFMENYPVAAI